MRAAAAPPRSQLRSLLATNFSRGRAIYDLTATNKNREVAQMHAETNSTTTQNNESDVNDDSNNEIRKSRYSNIIVNNHDISSFIESNLSCKECAKEGKNSSVRLRNDTYGLATVLTIECCSLPYQHKYQLIPQQIKNKQQHEQQNNIQCINDVSNYNINLRAVMGMQYSGLGVGDLDHLCGFLGLRSISSWSWRKLEVSIGYSERYVCDEIVNNNLLAEIAASPKDEAGKPIITASYDFGWEKRSSGNRYDSLSGRGAVIGAYTRKVLCYVVKAKKCSVCMSAARKNIEPPAHYCVKNHEGSSKSMEGAAAVELLSVMAKDKEAPVRIIIGDDDSTFRANIRHSYQAKIHAGTMTMAEWPKTK